MSEPVMPDMSQLLQQAQKMQEQLMAAQAEAAQQVVEGVAGGGVVKVELTGALEFRSVRISPEAVDPADVELLEDLVLAAIHDGMAKAQQLGSQAMGGLDLSGLDLGGLLGS